MLKLIDIIKEYKVEQESILALNNVSIEFRRNEFVSILGPSGCGKTTLLNIVGGLDRYTSGDIQIEGVSTKQYDDMDWDTYRNRRVGFVFQSYNLIPHLTILANVALSLTLAGVGRDERRARALEALKKVGLDKQAKKKPNQLSGGQMQRVAIARALVNDPEIILADEPTGALDSESGYQVMELLKEVAKDRLVIMVTHNPQLADEYSTRIVSLKDGEVVGDTMPFTEEDAAFEAACAAEKAKAESASEIVEADEEENVGTEVADEAIEEVTAEPIAEEAEVISESAVGGEEVGEIAVADSEEAPADKGAESKDSFINKLKAKMAKKRRLNRTGMKLTTAISLSWTNLISKKGRTLLTSIAGSIGIIGIILVLALSNGAKAYITTLEESALSNYPISVSQSSMDFDSMLGTLMSAMTETGEMNEETITVQSVLGELIPKVLKSLQSSQNDLYSFKKHVEANFDKSLADVRYENGTSFNVYAKDKLNDTRYMKINPYTETMNIVFASILDMGSDYGLDLKNQTFNIFGMEMTIGDALGYMSGMFGNVWSEISTNQQLLDSQYQLVGKRSRWPVREDEIVLVVNENNRLMDYQLFMLGLQSQDEVGDALFKGSEFAKDHEYSVDELLDMEYKILTNADYLEEGAEDNTWVMHPRTEQSVGYVDEHCVKFSDGQSDHVRVVGVIRPKLGSVATSITGVVGYSPLLMGYLKDHAAQNPAVQYMNEEHDYAVSHGLRTYESPIEFRANADGTPMSETLQTAGMDIDLGEEIASDNSHNDMHATLLRQLGYYNENYPLAIRFYCTSFDNKDKVEEFIADYNENYATASQQITYSDSLSSMMAFIDTMVNTITGVLVAFAAISLIVSTIMIAIIIYTSVLERRKEIGVLRSIGARKKDISRVFIAESAILGGYSGAIGIVVSSLLSLAISRILLIIFGIGGLMSVTWYHCLAMFLVSVLLSMLAGFVPSRIAANKDPAIALRSE